MLGDHRGFDGKTPDEQPRAQVPDEPPSDEMFDDIQNNEELHEHTGEETALAQHHDCIPQATPLVVEQVISVTGNENDDINTYHQLSSGVGRGNMRVSSFSTRYHD